MKDGSELAKAERNWFAVFTIPQNEKSTVKHLEVRAIESFLPTYETVKVWRNRQRAKLVLPLFPCYLFVHIERRERGRVLECPGVLQIVGNGQNHLPLHDSEVEFLRSELSKGRVEPYNELVVGERVLVRRGVMQGLQGTLVRKGQGMRFVLTIALINQNAAIEVDAEDLEPLPVKQPPYRMPGNEEPLAFYTS